MHINSMDDSGDLEEAYERLGSVFHTTAMLTRNQKVGSL